MQLATKLAIDEHMGQLVLTKAKWASQMNEAITELWVSYSVKNAIPKHVANIAHIIWMIWWREWQTDC